MGDTSPTHLLLCLCLVAVSIATVSRANALQDGCPGGCRCLQDGTQVWCASASLREVPTASIPTHVQYLDLSGNAIQEVHHHTLASFTDLLELDLSGNPISNISSSAFMQLQDLTTLKVSESQLTDDILDGLYLPVSLAVVDLHGNQLNDMPLGTLGFLKALAVLDLSDNNITVIPETLLVELPNLLQLKLANNNITDISWSWSFSFKLNKPQIKHLDLAFNNIRFISAGSFNGLQNLHKVDLQYNDLETLNPDWFFYLQNLQHLVLTGNPIYSIPSYVFHKCKALESLELNLMPNLFQLHFSAFAGLSHLLKLNLSNNTQLDYINAEMFSELHALQDLDLSYCKLQNIHESTFQNLGNLSVVNLQGNAWTCDCDMKWMHEAMHSNISMGWMHLYGDIICASPEQFQGSPLANISYGNYSCSSATVSMHKETVAFAIGSEAILNCPVDGDPDPTVTWITPQNKVTLTLHPAFVKLGHNLPGGDGYHSEHPWHDTPRTYQPKLPSYGRLHILQNGSLYIDYVTRHDTGTYTCIAQNDYGNATTSITFMIDCSSLQSAYLWSLLVAGCTAVAFTIFSIVVAVIRFVAYKCSKEQRQKRKGIRDILETLDAFKADKMDRLRDYKTMKFDQLTAFRTQKVDKLRNYKNLTFTTLVHYMARTRQHYSEQVAKIKDNCQVRVETLRDNYSNNVEKIKDYRSVRVDAIRDNYSQQVLKIREYGASQLEKLRDQYKLQQLHVMKIIEILDIGNCMTVIEAECMHTESMLFDPELNFDLDTHPVDMPRIIRGDDSSSEGDANNTGFLTADGISDDGTLSTLPPVTNVTTDEQQKVAKPTKHRHHNRKRELSDNSRWGSDESLVVDIKMLKKKKHKRPKSLKCNSSIMLCDDAPIIHSQAPAHSSANTTVPILEPVQSGALARLQRDRSESIYSSDHLPSEIYDATTDPYESAEQSHDQLSEFAQTPQLKTKDVYMTPCGPDGKCPEKPSGSDQKSGEETTV